MGELCDPCYLFKESLEKWKILFARTKTKQCKGILMSPGKISEIQGQHTDTNSKTGEQITCLFLCEEFI